MAHGNRHQSYQRVYCAKAAYPTLKHGGGGKIINIGSMMSIFGAPFAPAYAASKGGIVQLTRSLASAWARDNIQANAVLPGWIDTDLTRGAREQIPGLNWYGLAFWILSYAIVYSGLSAVRAKPNRHIAPTGAEPNYTMSFLTKEMPIVFLIAVAWHVGVIAGYL